VSDICCANCGASNDLDASACFACGKLLVGGVGDEHITLFSARILLNGRYRLLKSIGGSGDATVYQAEDTRDHKLVAIKSIRLTGVLQMVEATDGYDRELLSRRALKHAHLPLFYDAFTDQEHWYFVVQFIDGQTLERYVQQKPTRRLALWEALDIGIQLCDVLTYLHTRRPPVIFRAIQPDSIMRDSSGKVYLIDFGIERRAGSDTHPLVSSGYAAPEHYASAQTDERSDIYSLGATLQMLLTGRDPLADEDDDDDAYFMDQEVAKILAHMQAQEVDDRYATMQDVLSELEDIARRRGISQLVPAMRAVRGSAELRRETITASSFIAADYEPSMSDAPPPPTKTGLRVARWLAGGAIGVALVLILSVLLAPASSPIVPALDTHHTLVIGEVGALNGEVLDPALPLSMQDQQIEELLYSGLTTVNGQNQLVPGLAQSWNAQPDVTNDGLSWTFHLRPNLKFSNGTPLTSSDIAYTIDRVFSAPDSEYGYLAQYFKDGDSRLKGKVQTLIGDSLIVPDASTLIIKSPSRGVFLPSLMSANCFLVVNRELVEKYGNAFAAHLNEGGASGPFTRVNSIKDAEDLDLTLNPFYYDQLTYRQKAQIRQITVSFFPDIEAERAAYKTDALTMIASPTQDLLTVSERNDQQVALVGGLQYLAMNYLTKPFNNIKIRQAFALALNKTTIMDGAFKAPDLATNNIIPQGQPGHNPALSGPASVKSPQGNLTLARSLLQQGMQEEGIKSMGQFPAVTLTYNSGNIVSFHDEMTLIQNQWQSNLGITVKLQDVPGDQLSKSINGSVNNAHGLQLWYNGWIVDYPDPQNWTTLQFGKGSIWNAVNYGQNSSANASAQQQVQANLLKADAMQDPQKRLAAYQDAEQQLINDVAWLPIFQHSSAWLVKPSVHGYHVNQSAIISPDALAAMSIS